MLLRPIIILADDVVRNKHGEAISYNDLYGIYLPILMDPRKCFPEPLILAYDQSHFCPLLATNSVTGFSSENFLPLHQSVDLAREGHLLPVRFAMGDKTRDKMDYLLRSYLRIQKFVHCPEDSIEQIPITCVELGNQFQFDKHNFFLLYFKYLLDFSDILKRQKEEMDFIEEQHRWRDQDPPNQIISNPTAPIRPNDRVNADTPPPPYPGPEPRSNEKKTTVTLERRPSYERAVNNGSTVELLQPITTRAPQSTYERITTQRPLQHNSTHDLRPALPPVIESTTRTQKSVWNAPEPINGDETTEKGNNSTKNDASPRSSESRLKQGKQRRAS